MSKLLMLPPAPILRRDGERVRLDGKFVEGMAFICANWPGTVHCVLREGAATIPFGVELHPSELPFDLTVLPEGAAVPQALLEAHDLVEASADSHLDLDLADRLGSARTKCVFVIEYTLRTRFEILRLDRHLSPLRKARSALWLLQQERRRRRALSRADGVMVNGFPAFEAYRKLNDKTMIYLDNRMRDDMFAEVGEMTARLAELRAGGPLRLINSGRLEPMKGSQDLVPIARMLAEQGVNFTLDIYGTGSLEEEVRSGILSTGLSDRVRLHAPVDFETELVPISRREADLFLSCHRQSDPSCTYIEAMGCGLPVAGYANEMLAELVKSSSAGWVVPHSDTKALAARIADLAASPAEVENASQNAISYASRHGFAGEFFRRRQHMLNLLQPAAAEAETT